MTAIRPSRRRFLGILAASSLTAAAGATGVVAATPQPKATLHTWRGIALGADAQLQISHADPIAAQRLIRQAVAEMHRLEKIFSLYRADSALSTLNRQGFLNDPPADLVILLSESRRFGDMTAGAFDPTVQPLWDLYAAHFSRPGARADGPDASALNAALARVDYAAVRADLRQIRYLRPGMAMTLNGIAQGYITDRVTELLRNAGLDRALVDMGEIRGLDVHHSAAPWRVGLADPDHPEKIFETLEITNQAVSTSGGYETRIDPAGRFTHLFDPKTGSGMPRYRSVSIMADQATTADALSTAFSLMPLAATNAIVGQLGVKAWFVLRDGTRVAQAARNRDHSTSPRVTTKDTASATTKAP